MKIEDQRAKIAAASLRYTATLRRLADLNQSRELFEASRRQRDSEHAAVSGMTIVELKDNEGFAVLDNEGTEVSRHKKAPPLAVLKKVAKSWGLALTRSEDNEYRVNKIGGREATAAYTDDWSDAIGTGIAMAKKGAW